MQSSSRNGAKVRLIAVHTTEGIKRVGDLVAFFNRADAAGSSHAAADATGAVWGPERGFVPYDRAAWTLRNGNPVSDNLEYCGWAKTSRAQWLETEAKGLDAIARWLAERSKARDIPLVKLSPAEVKAGKSGVIGHADWTTGMSDGTHWDPGPGFPWDVVISKARAYVGNTPQKDEVDMTPAESQQLLDVLREVMALRRQDLPDMAGNLRRDVWTYVRTNGEPHPYDRLAGIDGGVQALVGQIAGLQQALTQIAANPGAPVNLDAVFKAAQDGARSIVDNLRVVSDAK